MKRNGDKRDVRSTASNVTGMTDQPKARILVVDDEQMLLDMVADALTFAGYFITVASDGLTALNLVRSERPDLVILDVNMPEPDGFQVAEGCRQPIPTCRCCF